MSFLSNFLKQAAPVVAQTMPGTPIGTAALVKTVADRRAAEKFAIRTYEQQQQQEMENRSRNMDPSMMLGQRSQFLATQPQPQSFFSRLGNIASNVGNTLLTGLESAVPNFINRQVFGTRPQSAVQMPAITTTTNVGAQESQGSGSIEAGAGSLLTPILSQARNLLKSPGGQLAVGAGGAGLMSVFGEQPAGTRITRKQKSQARMVLNMVGGNISMAADILRISEDMLVTILLKRFRNDGPVVTKAALRKTKQTIRRLHSMQDVLKSITPTATMRRRAPMKRATTTTLIKN